MPKVAHSTILSIHEAAARLGVSDKTLRRWEESGTLIPLRSEGGHRRYKSSAIERFKKQHEFRRSQVSPVVKNQQSSIETAKKPEIQESAYQSSQIVSENAKVTQNEVVITPRLDIQTQVDPQTQVPSLPSLPPAPQLFGQLLPEFSAPEPAPIAPYISPITRPVVHQFSYSLDNKQRRVLGLTGGALALAIAAFLAIKLVALAAPAVRLAQILPAPVRNLISRDRQIASQEQTVDSRVLAATDTQDDIVLKVYVPSEFWNKVTVNNDLVVSGNAAINGGEITSTAPILNIAEAGTGTINLGGGATAINLGSTSGLVTIRGRTLRINGVQYTFPSVQGGGGSYLGNDGKGVLTWSTPHQVSNFSELTGLVTFSQGGTNNSAGYPAGAVIYSDGSKLTSDNAHFFYDASNYRLGIGMTSPAYNLDVNGTAHISGTTTLSGATTIGSTLNVSGSTTLAALTAGATTLNGNLTLAYPYTINGGGVSGRAYNAFAIDAQTASHVASSSDLLVGGNLEVLGTIYGNVAGTVSLGFTPGSVTFADGLGNLAQDNPNFFWDNTNKRLGIGTALPTSKLYVTGAETGRALAVFDETGDQNILAASASSVPVFALDRSGNLLVKSGAGLDALTAGGTVVVGGTTAGAVQIGHTGATVGLTLGSDTTGDIFYRDSSGNLARLPIGSADQALTVNAGLPSWVGGSGTGTVGWWTRTGTTLSPSNVGDNVSTSGNIFTSGAGRLGVGVSSPSYQLDVNAQATSGTIFNLGYGTLTTLLGDTTGAKFNMDDGNVNADNQNVTGLEVKLPTVTNTITTGTKTLRGFYVSFGTGAGINQNGVGGITNYNALDVDMPSLSQTAGTLNVNGLYVDTPSSITTGGTAAGLYINASGVGAGTLYGLNITNITGSTGVETALNIGSGWDAILKVNNNTIINGSGVTQMVGGGTGFNTYTKGDMIYADNNDSLNKLGIGALNQVLVVNAGGVPSWGTISGSTCLDCVLTDPTGDQFISPTGNSTGLQIRQTNAVGPTHDIFSVTNNAGTTKYLYVDAAGVVNIPSIGSTSSDQLTITPGSDKFALKLVGTNVTTQPLQIIQSGNTSGTIFDMNYPVAKTLAGALTGMNIDLSTNLTVTNQSVTGQKITLPVWTNTHTSGTQTYTGLQIAPPIGSGVNMNGVGGTSNYTLVDLTMPALTQTAGTLNAYGINLTTPSSITTGGAAYGMNINASGIGAGSLYGLNIGNITAGGGSERAINIGTGWDYGIYSATTGDSYFAGKIGLGTTNLLATLDIRSQSGTLPVASFSGVTSFATLVADNSGIGDIFAASSSGLNRFVITQNGRVGIGTSTPTAPLDVNGQIVAPKINKVVVVDGVRYPQTCAGINSALTDLGANGELYLPAGTYTCAATITVSNTNVTIRGAGRTATIINGSGQNLNPIINLASTGTYTTIRDLEVLSNKGSGGASIYMNSSYTTIDNVEVSGADSAGIQHANAGGPTYRIANSIIYNSKGTGISLNYANDATVVDNVISGNATGIYQYNGSSKIANNYITGNTTGIYMALAGYSSTITGNQVVSNGTGIYLNAGGAAPAGVVISSNLLSGNTGHGIYEDGVNAPINISSNTISGTSASNTYGIYDKNTSYSSINNNQISGYSGTGGAGIYITSTSQYTQVINNQVFGNTTQIADYGASTQITQASGDKLGVGTASPTEKLTVKQSMAFSKVFYYNGATYTDNTTEAATSMGTPFTVLAASNNYLYAGNITYRNITTMYLNLAQAGSGLTLTAEYWNGAWTPLTITDGTNNLSQSGAITFSSPSNWGLSTINGTAAYWMRISTTAVTVAPTAYIVAPSSSAGFGVYAQSGDAIPALYVNQNGLIGLGTTTPATKLDVAGTVTATGLTLNLGSDATGDLYYRSAGATTARLGIGTEGQTLTVTGGVPSWTGGTGGGTGVAGWWQRTANSLAPLNITDDIMTGSTASASALVKLSGTAGNNSWINTGNFGIGTNAPVSKLDVQGGYLNVSGGATVSATYAGGLGLAVNGLGSFDWSPSTATTLTSDLLSLNVGVNGTIGNIFNVKNNGSSVFSVSQSQIVAGLPMQFTSPGDVSMAYDLQFTNSTASFINSVAPLYLQSGEIFNSSDLTLRTYNSGNVVIDSQALLTNYSATVAGQLVVGTTTAPSNIGNFYLTNSATFGKALAILNQTEGADIFTASVSGVTKFTIDSAGNVNIAGLTASSAVYTDANKNLTTSIPTAGALGYWTRTGTNLYATTLTDNFGLGTATPLAKLDVRGAGSGTSPIASFSGSSNFAGLVVDNGGAGDIFTASSSGLNRFVITQAGKVGVGTTQPSAVLDVQNSLISTTNGISGAFNGLTSGTALSITSNSNVFTTGGLASFDWSPTLAATTSGDLFSMNVGANGFVGNIFNVKNAGSSVFSVSQAQIVAGLPVQFTSPGDVSMAYDLAFTNSTSSFIKSIAPLYIEAGENYGSSGLTLRTFNSGNVVIDSQALLTNYSATVAGQLVVGTTTAPANIGNFYLTNSQTFGKALAILNQTEGADIFTASASGVSKFTINNLGNVGVGTTSPLAALDVRGTSGTSPIASFSGSSTFAGLVVDNGGTGDIFTASSSGLNRFVITQNGNVGIGTSIPGYGLDVASTSIRLGVSVSNNTINIPGAGANRTIYTSGDTLNTNGTFYASGDIGSAVRLRSPIIATSSNGKNVLFIGESGDNSYGTLGIGTSALPASFTTLISNPATKTTLATLALKAITSQTGDLFQISSLSGTGDLLKVTSSGLVGIGASVPAFRLDLQDSQAATVAAMITNLEAGTDADGLAIKLGFTGAGTAPTGGPPAVGNRFLTFLNGNGVINGAIQSDGADGVTLAAKGVDFAEYFTKDDPSADLPVGTMVCQGAHGVRACTSSDSSNIVGIVSAHPVVLGGTAGPDKVIVALIGQVPLNVTNANGMILSGDTISMSGQAGVGSKQTKAGNIVGKALEPNYSTDPNAVTQILVNVNISYFDPDAYLADASGYTLLPEALSFVLKTPAGAIVDRIITASQAVVANLQAGTITAENIQTNSLTVAGVPLDQYITQVVSQMQAQASASAALAAGPLAVAAAPSPSPTPTVVVDSIQNFSQASTSAAVQESFASMTLTELDTKLEVAATQIDKYLNLRGSAFIANDLGLGRALIVGRGLLLTDQGLDFTDAVAPADRQLSILKGMLVINDKGKMVVNADLDVNGRLTLGDRDAAGFALIKQGDTQVQVVFNKAYVALPVITATADSANLTVGLKDKSQIGFTIYLSQPATQDEHISWTAVAIKDALTFQSDGTFVTASGSGGVVSGVSTTSAVMAP